MHDLRHRLYYLGIRAMKAVRLFRTKGLLPSLVFLKTYGESALRQKLRSAQHDARDRERLDQIVRENDGRTIIVLHPLIDWNTPLFQRPHHIARELAALGYLYFFASPDVRGNDRIEGFKEIAPNCYLTSRFDLVDQLAHKKIRHLYSTCFRTSGDAVMAYLRAGDPVLYEYIDEIHSDISGSEVPDYVYQRHRTCLENEKVAVVASADRLLKMVAESRECNYRLVPNGVDPDHFAPDPAGAPVPAELRELVAKQAPVIGYYGSLAQWLDYELLAKLADERPHYQMLLIGYDYDGSLGQSGLVEKPNITVLDSVPYESLPAYSAVFDVAIVPFKCNDVTLSTSPIKIFEYMASGHPVVSTDLPECRKYPSVMVAESHDEFIEAIDRSLDLKNCEAYQKLLQEDAAANTWKERARSIDQLLGGQEAAAPAGQQ